MNIVTTLQSSTYRTYLKVFAAGPQWMVKISGVFAIWWFFSYPYVDYSYGLSYGFYDFYSSFSFLTYGLAVAGWVLHIILYSSGRGTDRVTRMPDTYFGRLRIVNIGSLANVYLSLNMFWHADGIHHFGRMSYLFLVSAFFSFSYFFFCTFKYGMGLSRVTTETSDAPVASATSQDADVYQNTVSDDVLMVSKPRYTFSDVYGLEQVKERIHKASVPIIKNRDSRNERNGILLFGGPGNGKTMIAEALAGELGIKFCQIEYGKTNGQWVGLKTAKLRRAFDLVRNVGPCVLFIDEIDSFIRSGEGMGWRNEENEQIVNFFLTELVNIKGSQIIVVAATNKVDQLDPRAIREGRFDFKIEITNPDADARFKIVSNSLHRYMKGVRVNADEVRFATDRWNGFNVKRLESVGQELSELSSVKKIGSVGYPELVMALRRIQGKEGYKMPSAKSLAEMHFSRDSLAAIRMISQRIANPYLFESLGGTIPNGVLFYGPPGTGKTATAVALALESGWNILNTTGPDLVRDSTALDQIYERAKQLRPALIFIDEADELLRDRRVSNYANITNKLLTIMDGSDERVKDVIFIAATNHPDNVDPACLRAGRFTEKVEFALPGSEITTSLVLEWLKKKNVKLADDLPVSVLCSLVEGLSPSNIEGVLQYALNSEIAKSVRGSRIAIGYESVASAISIVN